MVQIGKIDFPETLLKSLENNELVVFAGAGVSMGPPSNLPSFNGLAQDIGKSVGHEFNEKKEAADLFLGRLEDQGIDVKEFAKKELNKAMSFNPLHSAIISLYDKSQNLRIVTTNFDGLFEQAFLSKTGNKINTYCSPALPLGDDFEGLVHLHGSVSNTRSMILTDRDFGKAYLTDGWALRFLIPLFQKYSVLFIGYSYNDVVMKYLARALPPELTEKRFILSTENSDDDWRQLRLTLIYYSEKNNHSALISSLSEMADRQNRTLLDWKSRITDLCSKGLPKEKTKLDELEQIFLDTNRTKQFIQIARGFSWVPWLIEKEILDPFTKPNPDEWARWFASIFIDNLQEMIRLFINRQRMDIQFWSSIVFEVNNLDLGDIDQTDFSRIISFLLRTRPVYSNSFLYFLLAKKCSELGDYESLLEVLETYVSEYEILIEKSPWEERNIFKVNAAEYSNALMEIFDQCIEPNLLYISERIYNLSMWMLRKINMLEKIWSDSTPQYDNSSMKFHTLLDEIDRDEYYSEFIQVAIIFARKSLEAIRSQDFVLWRFYTSKAVQDKCNLIARIGLDALINSDLVDSSYIISEFLIIKHPLAWDMRPEVYELLDRNFQASNDSLKVAAFEKIVNSINDMEWDLPFKRKQLVSWCNFLCELDPSNEVLRARKELIQAEFPEIKPKPIARKLIEVGKVYEPAPSLWSIDELIKMTTDVEFERILNKINSINYWADVSNSHCAVQQAVEKDQDWAVLFAEFLVRKELFHSFAWQRVFWGLQNVSLNEKVKEFIINLGSIKEIIHSYQYDYLKLIANQLTISEDLFNNNDIKKVITFAAKMLSAKKVDVRTDEKSSVLAKSYNSNVGFISLILIKCVYILNKRNNCKEYLIKGLEKISELVSSADFGDYARPTIFNHFTFFMICFHEFAIKKLVPILTSRKNKLFMQAWSGFLNASNDLTSYIEEFKPVIIKASKRIEILEENDRPKFMQMCAKVAVYEKEPIVSIVFPLFKAVPSKYLHYFSGAISHILNKADTIVVDALWKSFLSQFLEKRINNAPVEATDKEIEVISRWLLKLGDNYPEAVGSFIKFRQTRLTRSTLYYGLSESELTNLYPVETKKLLIYLNKCEINSWDKPYIPKIIERLKDHLDKTDIEMLEIELT